MMILPGNYYHLQLKIIFCLPGNYYNLCQLQELIISCAVSLVFLLKGSQPLCYVFCLFSEYLWCCLSAVDGLYLLSGLVYVRVGSLVRLLELINNNNIRLFTRYCSLYSDLTWINKTTKYSLNIYFIALVLKSFCIEHHIVYIL